MPIISAALLNDAESLLSFRIQQLVMDSQSDGLQEESSGTASLLLGFGTLALIIVFYPHLLTLTYAALEFLVHG